MGVSYNTLLASSSWLMEWSIITKSAHWSLLNGDDELVWGPDPELTDTGRQQAAAAHAAWRRELKDNGAPLPQLHILSPFVRALDTAQITWKGLSGSESPFVVKELWRETMGEHVSHDWTTVLCTVLERADFLLGRLGVRPVTSAARGRSSQAATPSGTSKPASQKKTSCGRQTSARLQKHKWLG